MRWLLTKKKLLLLLTAVFLLIAWNRSINLLYGMFSLLSATLILAHVVPRTSLQGIATTRTLPSRAFEGDEIDVTVSLRNSRRMSRYMIEVVDCVPVAEPGLQYPMTFIAKIPGRKQREYSFKIVCDLRGEHLIGPVTLRSAYPLGISSVERAQPETTRTLLVYPRTFDIATFPLRGGQHARSGGGETFSREGGSDEFFGTREYRAGDSLKTIHWPSTAKHAQLIVKEFEMRAHTEATILIDLHKDSACGKGKESSLEYAVKIAASLAGHILARGHSLQLIGYGKEPWVVSYAKGMMQNAAILEALARVKADGNIPFPQAISRSGDLLRDGGTVILLFTHVQRETHWGLDDYLHGLSLLRVKRLTPIPVFIDGESFLDTKISLRHTTQNARNGWDALVQRFIHEGARPYFVSKGDDLEAVFSS